MNQTIEIGNTVIGAGPPKICIPLVGKNLMELVDEAELISSLSPDLVEWRVDFFEEVGNVEAVKKTLSELHQTLISIPFIFTFRSIKEGGEGNISERDYVKLYEEVMSSGLVDLIDVELFSSQRLVENMVSLAKQHGVYVILSNHDFYSTPSKDEIVARLRKAQELGASIPKIAVMPKCPKDVLTLLEATLMMKEQYADRPFITMSMAGQGVISRLSGEIFGSSITFGSAKAASAPGQMDASTLKNVLQLIHQGLRT